MATYRSGKHEVVIHFEHLDADALRSAAQAEPDDEKHENERAQGFRPVVLVHREGEASRDACEQSRWRG